MPNLSTTIFRIAAMATLVGGLAFTGTSYADTTDTSQTSMDQTVPATQTMAHAGKMHRHQQAMEQHIEKRIATLHDRLGITAEQEPKWGVVAQTMRDNEASISALMTQRYENRKTMSAVDDLQSYETITEAHSDGLKKLIPAFQALYTDMSDDQKKIADQAFGQFEGHRDGKSAKKHG